MKLGAPSPPMLAPPPPFQPLGIPQRFPPIQMLKNNNDMGGLPPLLQMLKSNNGMDGLPQRKRPHILKQIFIPLPSKNSLEAKEIEAGVPMSSPVLDRLPLPIRMIVSQIFRQQLRDEKRPSVNPG